MTADDEDRRNEYCLFYILFTIFHPSLWGNIFLILYRDKPAVVNYLVFCMVVNSANLPSATSRSLDCSSFQYSLCILSAKTLHPSRTHSPSDSWCTLTVFLNIDLLLHKMIIEETGELIYELVKQNPVYIISIILSTSCLYILSQITLLLHLQYMNTTK